MKNDKRIEVIIDDITRVEAEALVNAANSRLEGGGGVDGAIHKAAGPGLLAECMTLGGCPAGEACLTGGHNLRAAYIIHTVGPVWRGGHRDEHAQLASCYQASLRLAAENKIRTIAFPAISTGAYGFPSDQAALIALTETKRFISRSPYPEKVIFVLFDQKTYNMYLKVLNNEETAGKDK